MSEYNESISHSLVNSRQGIPEGLVGISQIREGRKIFQSSLLVFQFNFFFFFRDRTQWMFVGWNWGKNTKSGTCIWCSCPSFWFPRLVLWEPLLLLLAQETVVYYFFNNKNPWSAFLTSKWLCSCLCVAAIPTKAKYFSSGSSSQLCLPWVCSSNVSWFKSCRVVVFFSFSTYFNRPAEHTSESWAEVCSHYGLPVQL